MTPLGDLYRKMLAALIERDPSLQGTSRLDWIVVLAVARLFVDVEVGDLAQAMVEGNPMLSQGEARVATAYVNCMVAAAIEITAGERRLA